MSRISRAFEESFGRVTDTFLKSQGFKRKFPWYFIYINYDTDKLSNFSIEVTRLYKIGKLSIHVSKRHKYINWYHPTAGAGTFLYETLSIGFPTSERDKFISKMEPIIKKVKREEKLKELGITE